MPTHLEKAASKAVGTAKKVKGTLEGVSGVFKTLMEEHGEVSALLARLLASSERDTRARLWPTVRKELVSHEKGEVAVVFGAFQENPQTVDLALHHNDEAQKLASLIGKIQELDFDDPLWGPTLEQLVQLVKHHVQEEENEIFPAGQAALGDEKVEALNKSYLAKKKAVLELS
jgi:hemerythrin-like domain-containing protein